MSKNETKFMSKESEQSKVGQLEIYFKNCQLPPVPFDLNPSHKILDFELFLNSHFSMLAKAKYPLNTIYRPSYDRLIELKAILEKGEQDQA